MQDTTVRYVTGQDAYMQDFAGDIKRCQAADRRKLLEMDRAFAREEGIEFDDADEVSKINELEAAAGHHRRSARMIRQHFRAERTRAERAVARVPARPNARARGAGRPKAQATRSSALSGDSGSHSEQSEPPGYKPCLCGCGEDISHRARRRST